LQEPKRLLRKSFFYLKKYICYNTFDGL
jgi:hypothetical protein